jgi:hypothetical protein
MIPVEGWNEIKFIEARMLAEREANILRLFEIAKLDPKTDFRGEDWRYVRFDGLDLTGCDFSHARLYHARFTGARVSGANFRGSDVEVTNLDRALDWREAELDEDQRAILELKSIRHEGGAMSAERAERIRKAKKLTEREWVALIKAAKSFAIAEQVYDMMAAEDRGKLAGSKYALTSLLDKAETRKHVEYVASKFAELNVPLDPYAVNTFISKASTEAEARDIFNKHVDKMEPDIYTFNSLLSKIETFQGAQDVIEMMGRKGLRPDHISLHPFIRKAATLEEALDIYRRLEEPRTADMNMVLYHAEPEDFRGGGAAAELLRSGPAADTITFNILIRHAGTVEAGWNVVQRMKNAGFPPDQYTVFNMLSLVAEHDVDEAFSILSRCLREGVDINRWDVVRLVMRIISDETGEPQRIIAREEEKVASWAEMLALFADKFASAAISEEFLRAVSECNAASG